MVELEFSVLSRQCLDRRIPTIEKMQQEVEAWELERASATSRVNWRFTAIDARVKLNSLYPPLNLS